MVLGDFNPKLNSWYTNDSMNTEGSEIDILTTCFLEFIKS